MAYNDDLAWEDVAQFDGENGDDMAIDIAVDTAGKIYVTGRSEGSGTGYDYVTIKYKQDGTEDWVRRFDNIEGIDEAAAIAIDSTGVYVTGRSQGSGTSFDYYTIKYDSSGDRVWHANYNNTDGADEAVAIAVDEAGNVYITGKSSGSGTKFDYATVKYEQ